MNQIGLTLRMLLLGIVAYGMNSCTKEKTLEVEVEKVNSWTSDERFEYYNKTQLNSVVIGDKLAMLGTYGYTTIFKEGSALPSSGMSDIMRYIVYFNPSHSVKLPISARYFVGSNMQNNQVIFSGTDNPVSSGRSTTLYIETIDPDFRYIMSLPFSYGESIAINNQDQTLIAYSATTAEGNQFMRFLLVDVDPGDEITAFNGRWLKVDKTKVIALDDRNHTVMNMIAAFDDFFLVSSAAKVLKVDAAGNYKEVLDQPLFNMFLDKEILYAFGRNGNLWRSIDKGNSWLNTDFGNQLLNDITYTHVGEQLIGYRYSQIWEFDFKENGFEVQELDTDGLKGNVITSLNEFDGKVRVTTLSGVFNRPVEKFFEPKTEQ